MNFVDDENGLVVYRTKDAKGFAVAVAFAMWLIDPALDEDELCEVIEDFVVEGEGEITIGDIQNFVVLARATKFDERKDTWQ